MSTRANDAKEAIVRIPEEAVEAVARAIYGEDEYDALAEHCQAKEAYRGRARALLTVASKAVQNAHPHRSSTP